MNDASSTAFAEDPRQPSRFRTCLFSASHLRRSRPSYAYDHTQEPACPIAVGAATIYPNYCVPVEGHIEQTRDHPLNALHTSVQR